VFNALSKRTSKKTRAFLSVTESIKGENRGTDEMGENRASQLQGKFRVERENPDAATCTSRGVLIKKGFAH